MDPRREMLNSSQVTSSHHSCRLPTTAHRLMSTPSPGDDSEQRHRGAYDEDFFHKTLVTAVKIANDLADPDVGRAACTAWEIIRHAGG